jgi:hypothetical protein
VCITDVTIRFDSRRHPLRQLVVRNVRVYLGQTLDLYVAASHAQRRKMRRLGTIPVTIIATNSPEPDVTGAAILRGLRAR